MTYQVEITPQAEEELSGIVGYIAQRAPQAAQRFADNIRIAIGGLEELPHRCSVARESLGHRDEIRELLFGRRRNYRVLFSIRGQKVIILGIRHAARDDFDSDQYRGRG